MCQAEEALAAVVDHVSSSEAAGLDLQSHDLGRHRLALRGLLPLRARLRRRSLRQQVRELQFLLHVHRLHLRQLESAAQVERRVEGDAPLEEGVEAFGLASRASAAWREITPRSIRSARDCSIVCIPRLVPVCMTE